MRVQLRHCYRYVLRITTKNIRECYQEMQDMYRELLNVPMVELEKKKTHHNHHCVIQWHSQDIAAARAQHGHTITFVRTSARSAEA